MTALKNAAIRYAAVYAWHVHPLQPKKKTPATAHGLLDATNDDQQVDRWWSNGFAAANIGVNCGASDLLVLDFDINKPDYAGGDLLNQLLSEFPTVTAETGGGGFHMLYRQPDGEPLTNKTGALPTGVDVRGGGGYIVVPPSIHPNGTPYKWRANLSPGDVGIAPLPAFVLDLIKTDKAAVDPVDLAAATARDSTPSTARDDTISTFNRDNLIIDVLTQHGYTVQSRNAATARLARPGGTSGSVVVWLADNKSYHHSSSDPLNSEGNTRDAFDVWTRLEHAGDGKRAYEAAKKAQGKWDDDGDGIPVSAPQRQQQAQGAQQNAPLPTRSQKIKDLLAGNGWNFRLNILDNAVEINGERLTDIDESRIITYVRDVAPKAKISKEEVRDVINVMAHENQYHPIREYLDNLVWDGTNHIAELSKYITDKHSPIAYSDGKKKRVFPVFFGKWLISAVAKIYERGVIGAQSPMLVLSSGQDAGKSTLVKWLASGMLGYYNASDIKPDSEDHKRLLASKWIWEVGELGATTRKADIESLKHFLTLSDVTFRVPYGRHHLQKPALASFIGTVNPDQNQGFLSDPTGNRRFLTVELRDFSQEYDKHIDPNQLWAQAVALYRQGVDWRLTEEEKAMRDRINKVNTKREPILDLLLKYFDIDPSEKTWRMPSPDVSEYLLEKGYKGTTKSVQMAVANALRDEGLEKDDTSRPTEWVGIRYK